jgi:hypothetical protein
MTTKSEYDTAYNARPIQKKRRAMRNAARREYERIFGDQPASTDIDHKRRLDQGGTNSESNLRAASQTKNRGWRAGMSGKGAKGYGNT